MLKLDSKHFFPYVNFFCQCPTYIVTGKIRRWPCKSAFFNRTLAQRRKQKLNDSFPHKKRNALASVLIICYPSIKCKLSTWLFSRACFSRARLYFRLSVAKRRANFQAFLTETVETGDKTRDDFHCMQISLVMSMRLISAMTEMTHLSWTRFRCLAMT